MKVVVTGAGGGLGQAFIRDAAQEHDLVAFTRVELPIEDLGGVRAAIDEAGPDLILNCAAMTSVDGCEADPRSAFEANALGARNVAIAARQSGATLAHISTDYVFDGEKGTPYHEFDEPNAISEYGRSKLAGEREIAALAPDHLIARTSWVFGSGRDFLSLALARLAAGETIHAIADLVGSPTFLRHLASRLVPAVEAGARGVVHMAGPEPTSWYDLLRRSVDRLGLPGEVVAQKAEELGRPAPRPANSSLTSLVAERIGLTPMPPLDQALDDLIGGSGGD